MKLLQNLRKDKKGFTLIEVVIVLAIAALILVIVFLAVQGAQKSQRDNASKSGAGRAIAAAQNYLSDNGNVSPTATTPVDVTASCALDGSTTTCNFGKYFKDVKDGRGNLYQYSTTLPTGPTFKPVIQVGYTCVGGVLTNTGGSTVGVVYWSESANKTVCQST